MDKYRNMEHKRKKIETGTMFRSKYVFYKNV